MPIIIYGWRGLTSNLSEGDFDCPHCQNHSSYRLRQVRRFFTLFWIPIFPISSAVRYVECDHCSSQFREEVLDYRSPSPQDDTIILASARQLRDGLSVEEIRDKLSEEGEDRREMEALLVKLCEGQPWRCDCGLRYHPDVTRCGRCGKEI
jgi:Zn finger protein HypA/HybF involved in hydrogenase expression